MPSLSKPDVTKFDSTEDKISTARVEMETGFTSLNTIIDDYNDGTLGGGTTLPPTVRVDYDIESPDSAGTLDYALRDNAVNYIYLTDTNPFSGTDLNIVCDQLSLQTVNYVLVERGAGSVRGDNFIFVYKGTTVHSGAVLAADGDVAEYRIMFFATGATADSAGQTKARIIIEQQGGGYFNTEVDVE